MQDLVSGHNIAINALDFKSDIPFVFDEVCSQNRIDVLHPYNFGWAGFLTIVKPNGYQLSEISNDYKGFELKMVEYVSRYGTFWNMPTSWLDDIITEYRAEKKLLPPPQLYNNLLPDAENNIKEQNSAFFMSATFPIGAYKISAGLRYERTVSDYYQSGLFMPEQSRKFERLYPNIDFFFPFKSANFTLSYTAKTKRPLYSQLSSSIQYDDRFTYETGNPLLTSEINHDITLSGMYKWIYFQASYQYVKDAIVSIVKPYQENQPINLMTYLNYDHISEYSASLSLAPRISKWSPNLQLNLIGQDFTMPVMGKAQRMNTPLLFMNLYNSFSLGNNFTISGDIISHTAGDMDVVTLKPSWQINLGITKMLNSWYFALNATDLFRTANNSMITYGSQMKLDKWNYSDSQAVRITIRYSFNVTSNKYRGRRAGQSEVNRL